jgi:hypothetical protein
VGISVQQAGLTQGVLSNNIFSLFQYKRDCAFRGMQFLLLHQKKVTKKTVERKEERTASQINNKVRIP